MPASFLFGQAKSNPPVLLIVDIQNFYFPGGRLPLSGADAAAQNAGKILESFRRNQWPVVHVRHLPKNMNDAPLSGDVQWSFHPLVQPLLGESIVTKHWVNSFRETNLLQVLNDLAPGDLVIIGMQTHMCLEAAARAAADHGFSVTVIEDACATRDLEYAGRKIPAEQVHLSTLSSLQGSYAKIVTTAQFLSQLAPPAGKSR